MNENSYQPGHLHEFVVDAASADTRVDVFVAAHLEDSSRSQVARYIKEGLLTVNGQVVKANYRLRPGEVVEIVLPVQRPTAVEPENIPLDIVFEDDELIVINKPAGMVSHPGTGNRTGTLVNALMHHCAMLSPIGAPERAGIVHRLDKGTSGLLVAAKTESTHRALAAQLQDKTLFREYLAFAWGHVQELAGVWDLPIGRSATDPTRMKIDYGAGRDAVTEYEVVQRYAICDKLRLRLKTGRTHQIRVHLAHFNHPVFGDPDYSGRETRVKGIAPELRLLARRLLALIDRPALHAARLGFTHPRDGKRVEFAVDPPADMQKLEEGLAATG